MYKATNMSPNVSPLGQASSIMYEWKGVVTLISYQHISAVSAPKTVGDHFCSATTRPSMSFSNDCITWPVVNHTEHIHAYLRKDMFLIRRRNNTNLIYSVSWTFIPALPKYRQSSWSMLNQSKEDDRFCN